SSNSQNPSHSYQNPGKYSVSLLVEGNVCISSITKQDYIQIDSSSTGILFSTEELGIRVYPNPSKGIFRMEGMDNTVKIQLRDVQGKEVAFTQVQLAE